MESKAQSAGKIQSVRESASQEDNGFVCASAAARSGSEVGALIEKLKRRPQRTGSRLLPETTSLLAKIFNILGWAKGRVPKADLDAIRTVPAVGKSSLELGKWLAKSPHNPNNAMRVAKRAASGG